MIKAIFLDRDGTIIEDKNYLNKTEDIVFLTNAIAGMKMLVDSGYMLFIISNQSGVARGYFSEENVIEINNYIKKTLLKNGVKIEKILYCPHHKDGIVEEYKVDCNCRKPKVGMIKKITDSYLIDLEKSFVIGDKSSDMQLAKNCGCRSVLVLTGYGEKESALLSQNDCYVEKDLLSSAKTIVKLESSLKKII